MNQYCVKNCEFILKRQDGIACLFYAKYLSMENDQLLRCIDCKKAEFEYAQDILLRGVTDYGSI